MSRLPGPMPGSMPGPLPLPTHLPRYGPIVPFPVPPAPPPEFEFGFGDPGLEGSSTPLSEDTFSVIDETFQENAEERGKIVQELWESPDKKCACCIPWQNERPEDGEPEAEEPELEDEMPIIVRKRRTMGGKRAFELHSIEIRSAPLREVLFKVFDRYDGLIRFVKYLTFLAPFKVFYWRWEEFEQAIKDEKDEEVAKQLRYLRRVVKTEIHHTFTVTKELLPHGVVTHNYLWALFKPGELIYCNNDGIERFYALRSCAAGGGTINLYLKYLDWDGHRFGLNEDCIEMPFFPGSKRITEMAVFPARYLDEDKLAQVKERLMARGRKFVDLAGIHHKSLRENGKETDRIIIDAAAHTDKPSLDFISGELTLSLYSGMINQVPIQADDDPEKVHIPVDEKNGRTYRAPLCLPPPPCALPPPPAPIQNPLVSMRETNPAGRKASKFNTESGEKTPEPEEKPDPTKFLTGFHILIATPLVRGFNLKDKCWRRFKVDHVHDIEWNAQVFDQLVLPDGYKDLILAHVESQLREEDGVHDLDDIVNGKGGGLVILLAGEPGVGKTLTCESVAERIQAPLYKMELSVAASGTKAKKKPHIRRAGRHHGGVVYESDSDEHDEGDEISEDFELAARWKAVLLIDECDTYLQRRSDVDARRNRVVAAFLQKLEYYPSLLFLTTNREATLDIALQSRVHLTINYPALDFSSRVLIWRNFLARCEPAADVSEDDLVRLASIELNGRRIKNVVKTAQIMARKLGRGVREADVEKVLRITEGLVLVDQEGGSQYGVGRPGPRRKTPSWGAQFGMRT